MGKEIERKFLVIGEAWRRTARASFTHVRPFRQTHDIRHSAIDAESRGSKHCNVWEFRAAGRRGARLVCARSAVQANA